MTGASLRVISRDQPVPRLCYGTLAVSPLQRPLTPSLAAHLLNHAAALGITLLDTAEYYNNYPSISIALRAHPSLTIITKSYAWDRPTALASVRKAQRLLRLPHIPVMLMHEQESELTVLGHLSALQTYRELQSSGEIGSVGLSTHRVAGVRAAIKHNMDVVCAIINVDGLGLTDGALPDMERALRDAHDAGLFVIGMKILGGGHLISRRDESIRYALSLDFLDCIALGMSSIAEINYNASLFLGLRPDERAALESARAPRTLMIEEGCVGCGLCAERCGQRAIIMEAGQARAIPERCVRCGYCAAACPQVCIKIV
ncbi:MAG: aldo/keto reductase [Oscillospiraceae bacterium]|nr:aldo/keto reductase [Oscillospiraceae bacterium]